MKAKRFYVIMLMLAIQMRILHAQDNGVADILVADNKINAVIATALVILLGIVGFLIHLEKKLRKIEKGE